MSIILLPWRKGSIYNKIITKYKHIISKNKAERIQGTSPEFVLALIATERAVVLIFSERTILLLIVHWQWTCALAHARLSNKSLWKKHWNVTNNKFIVDSVVTFFYLWLCDIWWFGFGGLVNVTKHSIISPEKYTGPRTSFAVISIILALFQMEMYVLFLITWHDNLVI